MEKLQTITTTSDSKGLQQEMFHHQLQKETEKSLLPHRVGSNQKLSKQAVSTRVELQTIHRFSHSWRKHLLGPSPG